MAPCPADRSAKSLRNTSTGSRRSRSTSSTRSSTDRRSPFGRGGFGLSRRRRLRGGRRGSVAVSGEGLGKSGRLGNKGTSAAPVRIFPSVASTLRREVCRASERDEFSNRRSIVRIPVLPSRIYKKPGGLSQLLLDVAHFATERIQDSNVGVFGSRKENGGIVLGNLHGHYRL